MDIDEALDKRAYALVDRWHKLGYINTLRRAALDYDVAELIRTVQAEAAPRWIPVAERLPQVNKATDIKFLVTTIYETVDPARYNPNLQRFEYLDGDGDFYDAEATHWMEYPPPATGKEA